MSDFEKHPVGTAKRLAELEARCEWRPIETAPRDEWFLGCSQDSGGWMQTLMVENWGKKKEKWVLIDITGGEAEGVYSHWMPLPTPPGDCP